MGGVLLQTNHRFYSIKADERGYGLGGDVSGGRKEVSPSPEQAQATRALLPPKGLREYPVVDPRESVV